MYRYEWNLDIYDCVHFYCFVVDFFDIPKDVVQEYRHPALVSIRDLHKSPVKRRATVRGVVSEVIMNI